MFLVMIMLLLISSFSVRMMVVIDIVWSFMLSVCIVINELRMVSGIIVLMMSLVF